MNVDYNNATVAELAHRAESGDEHARFKLFSRIWDSEAPSEERELALQSFRRLAEAGDASIQGHLGDIYRRRGEYAEAIRWYRLANEQQPGYSQRELVKCFLDDPDASEADKASALQWLGDAARSGDDRALEELLDRYHEGRGVPKDPAEEAKWYEVAASLLRSCPSPLSDEFPRGAHLLEPYSIAVRMVVGKDAPDEAGKAALEWLRRAANEGFEPALRLLYHRSSKGGERHDAQEAAHWAHVAAQLLDDYLKKSEDERELLPLDDECIDDLVSFLLHERGVPAEDKAVALRFLRSKAYGGDPDARCDYAEEVLKCESSAADAKEEALQMLREAAEQGDSLALMTLQHAYLLGEGVPQSYAEAAKWYRLAADQGDAESQYLLGELFAQGLGVERSLAHAAEWMRKAFNQPAPEAPAAALALEAEIARLRTSARERRWKLNKPEA